MAWWRLFWRRWGALAEQCFRWAGLALVLLAAVYWAHEWHWNRSALHASGTILELEGKLDGQGQINYFPRVRFRLPDGTLVQAVSRVGGNPPDFAAGDVVPVRYSGSDPQHAEIATTGRVYLTSIVLGVLGVVLFDLGAVLWIVRRRGEMRDGTAAA